MNNIRIINADVLDGLRGLEDESVHCVVTSPPYWGLRDYGVDGQIGLEGTPQDYAAALASVFLEVRRVLRADGTLWLNLGDCYMGGGRGGGAENCKQRTNVGSLDAAVNARAPGFKPKDLVGIPWRVAFALQANGWYLRSDIIWHKPNPMPESVTDRPTKAHEYIFLCSKSQRYQYNHQDVLEPLAGPLHAPGNKHKVPGRKRNDLGYGDRMGAIWGNPNGRNMRSVWTMATTPYTAAHFATFPEALAERCIKAGCPEGGTVLDPFGGAGTTGLVAAKLGRDAVIIELSPEYAQMAEDRIAGALPLMANVTMEGTR